MYAVVITDEGGAQRRLDFSKPQLTVGRVNGNDIVLAKRNVSKQHAQLSLEDEKAVVVDLNSTNGTWVNGRKITAPHPLKSGDKIYIADFIITLEEGAEGDQPSASPPSLSEPPAPPSRSPSRSLAPKTSRPARPAIAQRTRTSRPKDPGPTSLPPRVESRATDEAELRNTLAGDPLEGLMSRLSRRLDVENVDPNAMKDQERWSATRAAIAETFLAMQKDGSVDADVDMRQIAHTALHEIVGLGALDDVLSNDEVRLVTVNGPNRVTIDTGAGPRATALTFSSSSALDVVARRLAAQCGHELGTQAVFQGRLSFGPRVTIMQKPLVASGLFIEIHVTRSRSLDELAEDGVLSTDSAAYLTKAVAECRNVVVLGPSGSGVTPLLSALCAELPDEENTVVVEAVPDLEVDRDKVVALNGSALGMKPAEVIAHGARLRADHLVINDLASQDVVAALGAIAGREPGHLLGVHAAATSNPVEGLLLAATSTGADRTSVAQRIAQAVHTVVAMESTPEGHRVSAILEVEGAEAGDVSYQSVHA
ncbi:MAG: ATPase, T2SS/T4P/T4SS family [Myxococcota bacterium]